MALPLLGIMSTKEVAINYLNGTNYMVRNAIISSRMVILVYLYMVRNVIMVLFVIDDGASDDHVDDGGDGVFVFLGSCLPTR